MTQSFRHVQSHVAFLHMLVSPRYLEVACASDIPSRTHNHISAPHIHIQDPTPTMLGRGTHTHHLLGSAAATCAQWDSKGSSKRVSVVTFPEPAGAISMLEGVLIALRLDPGSPSRLLAFQQVTCSQHKAGALSQSIHHGDDHSVT